MNKDTVEVPDELSGRTTLGGIRRQVDDHNKRVMDTVRIEVERIERTEGPQLRNALIGVTVVLVVFLALFSAYIYWP
jgi:hypothetical protein